MDAAALWDITDPLTLDARKHMQYLLELIPQDSPFVDVFLKPSLTLAIAWSFRPLLMDLCARWLEDDGELYAKLEGLAMLIEVHEELYPILSLFLRQKHFEDGPLSHVLNNYPIEQLDERLLHRILLAYYRILSATPSLPKSLNWDLSFLLKLCTTPHPDRGVCWLAIRCYALQSEMNERNRENAERSLLGEIGIEDCLIHYGEDISGSVKDVDGWMLPMLEVKRIQDYRIRILNSTEYFSKSGAGSGVAFEHQDLSPRIVNAHGILLLRTPSSQTLASTLVLTSPALVSIRKIAVNISLRRPTLLSSSPSSGKAAFLDHLALLLYPSKANHIVTIHLADTSLDPRSLLGSYVSSSTHAGSFEWKDGVLVKAMREGKWVVFKDIDRASTEVLGLIGPLVESMDDCKPIGSNALLSVVNRGSVEAAESFSLFATRSVEGHGAAGFPPPSFLGAQKWREVMIPDNTLDDLQLIVDSKFPKIAGPVADCLIDIWQTVKRLRSLSSTRPVGIRDLEKFCRRVSGLLETHHAIPSHRRSSFESVFTLVMLLPHPSLREDIYLEARDVFFAAGATNKTSEDQRSAIAMTIGEKLGLSEETCDWVLKRRTPPFEIEKDVDGRPIALRFGRTSLVVNSVISISDLPPSRSFSMHKQAVRLISQLAACVLTVEPVLLTGETGTGKTSVISHLATLLGRPLVSLNLSNQTESADLIGGFRPVSARIPALELQQRFFDLFQKTFSNKRNEKFHQSLRKAVADARWKTSVKLWNEASKLAVNRLQEKVAEENALATSDSLDSPLPRKRRKLQSHKWKIYEAEWAVFEADVRHFEVQHVLDKGKFAFHYVEGPLVKAIRTGAWVLLDEINLASSETLECISSLLQGPNASVTLTEQGSLEPVPRHHDFRLFACMNPATDVGKKDLSRNIRAKFTEIDVPSPDEDQEALISIISHYIGHLTVTDKSAIFDVAQFYTSVKRLSELGKIADGSDRRPHYSMRSLSRALIFAADTVQSFGLRRALWEGFTMAFTMVLNQASADAVLDLARRTLLSGVKNTTHFLSHLSKPPQATSIDSPVQLGPFWLSSGPNEREDVTDYILTPSVQKKLVDLARIIMIKRFPILIEGPTSSGKTSAIQYLARRTGHSFIRINNHEHTDIQEYLGSYASDPKTGKLVFRDGLLVRALRRGDWVVLDELNLAPTDVLEALNRLLDDNRELVIPETQEVVRPHPHFMLFATQNPPGVYAGRKVLSRALRNRFLEVHFDDVPQTELEHILCQKSLIAPSYSQRIVAVFHELQKRRQMGRIFEGKEGFATLRDLFRWAGRDAQGYQELAENGYMLLAERVRHEEDKNVVKEVIEKAMNVTVSEDTLYNLTSVDSSVTSRDGIVWTRPMQRLFILLSRALRFNEPVLLVGETGSGKTSMCQIYAATKRQILRTVNCHQNTEASDIIGGLRPVRQESSLESAVVREALEQLNADDIVDIRDKSQIISAISARLSTDVSPHERNILATAQRALSSNPGLLEWQDGPLVTCMRSADVFLLDEISLADDSVLERLNSVLEPSRTLVLAERGGEKVDDFQVVAKNGFNFVATMNPGGDFGKKELSPALRNRFTEIWVPSTMKRDDLYEIVKHSWKHDTLVQLTGALLDFVDWIVLEVKDTSILTLRDILSWVKFCNTMCPSSDLPPAHLFVHGGQMAVIDGLSSLTQLSSWSTTSLQALRQRATQRLEELSPGYLITKGISSPETSASSGAFHIGPFSVPLGSLLTHQRSFNFKAPTSLDNAFRLIRACQISKPIILEGSPGVGKTSLVSALAAAAGQRLCRINLSEQTDLVDLFGSDLPVDGDAAGKFAWRDADFLQALKNGHWVLLDEMNLASQSVLEGLNAVFDHRGTVFIPELDRSFSRHPNFRVFAAQNPLNQGSGRKGLPKSFLNRFTKVFVEQLSASDLLLICRHLFPSIPVSTLQLMIDFNCRLHDEVVVKQEYGILGSPWEFNLRDIIRWASLMERADGAVEEPWKYLNAIYRARFRCESDRLCLLSLFATVFGDVDTESKFQPRLVSTPDFSVCGSSVIYKGDTTNACHGARLRTSQLNALDAALSSISRAWLLIITGPQGVGKTSFVRSLASVAAQPLQELSLGSSSDTSDLIGSYEQIDNDYHFHHLSLCLLQFIDVCITRINSTYNSSLEWLLKLKKDALGTFQSRSLGALADIARATITATPSDGSLRHLKTLVEAALVSSQRTEACGPRFEWIDGPLVRALKTGEWLLLDNANLCSPSVLDRLNSLCEIEGSLILTEKGVDQQTIIPHRNFRLIMTVDPYRGEISRAMRNRGIEIALDTSNIQHDMGSLLDAQRLPPNAALVRSPAPHLRSVFELNRRMLLPSFSGLSDKSSLPCSTILVYNDSLASQMNDYRTVITESDSSTHDALVFLLFGSSTVVYPRHFLRLLKSLEMPQRLSEDLSFLLKGTESLNTSIGELTDLIQTKSEYWTNARGHMPNQPYLATSFINWSSENDLEVCKLTSNLLEAYALVTILEYRLQLQEDSMSVDIAESDRLSCGSTSFAEHEEVKTFLISMPTIVQKTLLYSYSKKDDIMQCSELALKLVHHSQHLHRAACQRIVNYSELYAVSGWIYDCIKGAPLPIHALEDQATALRRAFTLTSGQSLLELWNSFYRPKHSSEVDEIIQKLGSLTLDSRLDHDLQRRIFEALALFTISQKLDEQNVDDWHWLKTKVEANLTIIDDQRESSQNVLKHRSLSALLAIELDGLICLYPREDKLALQDVIRSVIQSDAFPFHFRRMLSYQQLTWKIEANKNFIPELLQAHLEWHRSTWKEDELLQSTGPSALFTPVLLRSTVFAGKSIGSGTLKDSWSLETLIDDEIQRSLIECFQSSDRKNLVVSFLLQSIIMTCCACLPSTSENQFLREMLRNARFEHDSNPFAYFVSILRHLEGTPLHEAFGVLGPALEKLATSNCSWPDRLHDLGLCWILLSRTLLSLYVPNLSLDPVTVQGCKSTYQKTQEVWINSQIHLHSSLENMRTGNHTNVFTRLLQDRLLGLENEPGSKALPRKPSGESDTASLQSFWKETRTFLGDIVSPERMEKFLVSSELSGAELVSQEKLFQDSASNFLRRMSSAYAPLSDLLPAIELSLMQLRFGLRAVQHALLLRTTQPPSPLLTDIMSFPSARAGQALLKANPKSITHGEYTLGNALLSKLVGLAQCYDGSHQVLVDVESVYDQFSSLWNADLSREAEKARQAESLYRSRQTEHDAAIAADLEEKEMEKLFPTFSEADMDNESSYQDIEKAPIDGVRAIEHETGLALLKVHLRLFGNGSSYDCDLQFLQDYSRLQMVTSWTDRYWLSMPCGLDSSSLAFRLDLLRRLKARFQRNDIPGAYSFYHDANLSEARKATDAVECLRKDLRKLVREWPDQLVLQHLCDRCDSMLSMSISSPVAKILGALERLLVHTEDWEMFANRENSLKSHRQVLTSLIVEWRKLELVGWRRILESEAKSFLDSLADWWFRLYDASVRGVLAASQEMSSSPINVLDNYFDSLTPLLEDFLRSAPLGQYGERLRLLQSFSSLTFRLATVEHGDSKLALQRSSEILTSVHHFYDQFSVKIGQSLMEQRAKIEKDIQSLVQLATWRDVNVHALQQSAQRTHKQLYRRIRKFREVLRQPISDQFQVGGKETEYEPGKICVTKSSPRADSRNGEDREPMKFSIVSDAPKSFRKFRLVLSKELDGLIDSSSTSFIEDLCSSIITVQEDLLRSSPPEGLSATDRKKWNSSLLTRKKRSWIDFLKELKRIGITPNVKPDILHMHRSRRRMMEQPSLTFHAGTSLESVSRKIDIYLYRSVGLLFDLLQVSANHHHDISTRELQRGTGSFESALSFGLGARTKFVALVKAWDQARLRTRRLHALEQSRGTCTSERSIQDALMKAKLKSSGLAKAMEEIVGVARNILSLSRTEASVDETVFQDLQHWNLLTANIKQRLSALSQDADECSPGLIFEDNLCVLRTALGHFDDTSTFLANLARRTPKLRQFCDAIRAWLSDQSIDPSSLQCTEDLTKSPCDTQRLVDLMLVTAQDLLAIEKDYEKDAEPDGADHIRRQICRHISIMRALKTDAVLAQLSAFTYDLQSQSRCEIDNSLRRVLPFLDQYIVFFERHLSQFASWIKSLFKLVYISGSLIRNISLSGFCKPPNEEEMTGAEGQAESAEGVGLGQGTGNENVSDQIEDESQFEGVKDQDDEMGGQQNEDPKGEDLDVDFDLAGELEDGPDHDPDGEDENESMSDLDDEFGHDVPQANELNPVDEKFWNDQPDSEDEVQDAEDGKAQAEGESEMVAKEQDNRANEGKPAQGSDESNKEQKDLPQDENSLENISEDSQMNDIPQGDEAESADAPDHLPPDEASEESHLPEEFGEIDEGTNEANLDSEQAFEDDQPDLGDGVSEASGDADYGPDQTPMDTTQDEQNEQEESQTDVKVEADIHPGANADASAVAGNVGVNDSAEENVKPIGEYLPSPPSDRNEPSQAGPQGVSFEADNGTEPLPSSESTKDSVTKGTEAGQTSTDSADLPLPNPHRSLGDALREVRRRFDEIQNSNESEAAGTVNGSGTDNAIGLEYAPDDIDVDMQALGPAMEEEHAKLNNLNVLEEVDETHDGSSPPETTQPSTEYVSCPPPVERSSTNSKGGAERAVERTETATSGEMDVDEEPQGSDEARLETLEDEQEYKLDRKVETQLNKWRRQGQPVEDGHRIWQLYDSLTQSLSFSLCEQLRLILEPTRATRLMGDFRTGKRLNMKKIIPYIASNYTKDKIWLRRVRPSQREYQVLIALDDSRSMAESHSIHLAFQTLALVSKALNRLEVGDLAIASFGESMHLLHGFEDGPFTDQTGAKVVEAFKFQQTATDVRSLLEASVDVLTKARERRTSSSSSDLWQLQIIISDGICQDHEELRAIMRKAEEEHILIVFIVIDAHSDPQNGPDSEVSRSQNSILHMNQAMYRTVNGRLELHMQRYLDSFPFEFFVILKNVEALPDVLADTLRQFFERITAS